MTEMAHFFRMPAATIFKRNSAFTLICYRLSGVNSNCALHKPWPQNRGQVSTPHFCGLDGTRIQLSIVAGCAFAMMRPRFLLQPCANTRPTTIATTTTTARTTTETTATKATMTATATITTTNSNTDTDSDTDADTDADKQTQTQTDTTRQTRTQTQIQTEPQTQTHTEKQLHVQTRQRSMAYAQCMVIANAFQMMISHREFVFEPARKQDMCRCRCTALLSNLLASSF